ncbi:MAG: glycosyltransferase family 2 protein [Synergistaceae bacterium]|nr:glycosyltransferase family 2 protein [Synergistaceae bacterium]
MSEQLVSVIIPVHNAEAHVARTLESVLQQDYARLEIIVVNDASTDSTRNIVQALLQEGGRTFRIIDLAENLGVSAARNTGLASASGKYVWFCDGDDIAESNLISELCGIAEKFDSDIAFGGIADRFEDGRPDELHRVTLKDSQPLDGEYALYMRMQRPIAPHLCCMLFRKSLLDENDIRFTEGCTAFEDIEFQMKAFCHADKVSFSPECMYVYVHSSEMGSVRDNNTPEKRLSRYVDSSEAHRRTAEYLLRNAPSKRTRYLAENMLMPEAMIRSFTVCARAGDKKGFDALLNDANVRRSLLSSRKVFLKKPEIFAKALAILCAPGLYFRMRREK